MGLKVGVAFLGPDRQGHESDVVVDGLGRSAIALGECNRGDANGGGNLGGLFGGADLGGFGFESGGLEGGGFGFDGLHNFGQGSDGGVLDGGFDLELLEFRGGADGEFLDSSTEVIAFGEAAAARLRKIESRGEELARLEGEIAAARKALLEAGAKLGAKRKTAAPKLITTLPVGVL